MNHIYVLFPRLQLQITTTFCITVNVQRYKHNMPTTRVCRQVVRLTVRCDLKHGSMYCIQEKASKSYFCLSFVTKLVHISSTSNSVVFDALRCARLRLELNKTPVAKNLSDRHHRTCACAKSEMTAYDGSSVSVQRQS
jgi:hypothetical protein